jgi:hypothetical protein
MRSLWAYAYQIVPPQPSSRLGTIRTLLTNETAAARGNARTWAARLVLERSATHILIVSDAPGRDQAINRRLEAELARLDALVSVTEPLAVAGHVEAGTLVVSHHGNGR